MRLALAAGGNEHDLFRAGSWLISLDVDQHAVRGMQVPQFAGDAHGVGDHAAAGDGHLAARLNGAGR